MIMFKVVGVPPLPNPEREPGLGGMPTCTRLIRMRWPRNSHRACCFLGSAEGDDDGLRGFELKDVDGYVLFFGRTRAS